MEKISLPKLMLIAFLCAYMIVLPGCNNDNNPSNPDETAPEIPPIESMKIGDDVLSLFNPGGGLSKGSQVLPKQNWFTAAVVVWAFNTIVLVGLSIPTVVTAAALSVEPTLERDGKWHWNYSYPEVNPTLHLELTGQIKPGEIEWEMLVTRTTAPQLTDFLWYRGVSEIGGGSGVWTFYNDKKPNENAEFVTIKWEVAAELDRTLKFTDKNEDSQGFGNTLTYSIKDSIATVLFSEAATSDTTEISWNTNSHAGYIIAPSYLNGEKACWDEDLNNADCGQ